MKILSVIPARGGSKRIPGKNIRLLGNKPLIAWTLESSNHVLEICDQLVSTDDPQIAEIAQSYGGLVPWLRPADLATDVAKSVDVCLHALEWYENSYGAVDGLLLLQPTSPFRSEATIKAGIELFSRFHQRPVVSVSPAKSHPLWCFRLEDSGIKPFLENGGLYMRSQDLPPAYSLNGAFYLIKPDQLRNEKSFFPKNLVPLIMKSELETIDLDTLWDWQIAEAVLAKTESERSLPG
jgi:N-acylneuraminate cytidylyltransferase